MRFVKYVLATSIVALVLAATATASPVTVGSPLTADFDTYKAKDPITLLNTSLPEPGANLVSPVDGAIVHFRILGVAGFNYSLRVLRPRGGNLYTAVGTSEPLTVVDRVEIANFRPIPINAGDTIGVDIPVDAVFGMATPVSGAAYAGWSPLLPEGATLGYEGPEPGYEVGFNAEVQPAPALASVSPRSGFVRGGTEVTIKGTDFAGVKSVEFGSVRARRFRVGPEGQIVATAPATRETGVTHVTVTTVAGHTRATAAARFEFTACQTPRLLHKKLATARRVLKRAGCRLGKVTLRGGVSPSSGRVTSQGPKPQLQLPAGTKVNVTLG